MTVHIREAKIEDAHAIVAAEKEIAKTPGYFCSQPDELSTENVINTITKLSQSKKGVYVRATNSRAIALYKKMGFIEEGRLKNRIKLRHGYYIDDILMALHVSAF